MSVLLRFISVFVLLSGLAACTAQPVTEDSGKSSPKLIVLLSIDQLRPERLSDTLPGGLGRLMREGYVFENATLDHGVTTTCPGHIVMSTGMNPAGTGITSNSYIDHTTGVDTYCVHDPDNSTRVLGAIENRSPRVLTASTLGDWLKEKSPDSRVFSVSGKDRAAITMGGKQADGVYWFNSAAEKFTTSGYYRSGLPRYIEKFNGRSFFEDGYGSTLPARWEHGAGTYRPDDYVGESPMNGRVSGHPMNTGAGSATQFYFSPFVDMATGELARRLFRQEKLGSKGATDLLAVSFSATDTVGHLYGPFSAESADGLARLDREVGLLLDDLDAALGGNYVLALSADHGVMPLPEWLVETGEMNCPLPGGRLELTAFGKSAYGFLIKRFGVAPDQITKLVAFSSGGTTVNRATALALNLDPQEVIDELETFLEQLPSVAQAWTHAELMASDSEMARLLRNSYVDGKTGHLLLQMHENCLVFRPEGTSHGSPYLYDRAVPLIFFGRGVTGGRSTEEAHSIDMSPTIADLLDLPAPSGLDGRSLRAEITAESE